MVDALLGDAAHFAAMGPDCESDPGYYYGKTH